MAKKKPNNGDRDLGVITKKDASGFFITNEGEKIPASNGLKIGDKVKLVNREYVVNGGKADKAEPKEAANLTEVNAKIKALEKELVAVKKDLAEVKTELGNKVDVPEAGADKLEA